MNHTNKIAVVTGANRGLGLEASKQLAKLGVTVLLTSRDQEKGKQALQSLHQEGLQSTVYHRLDVTHEDDIARIKDFVLETYGHLDILINNAGIFPDREESAFTSTVDILRAAMETNVYGSFRLCQTCIPIMKTHNYGRIVNMSSGMGQLSDMNGCCPGYRISKTALNALTRLLADELKGTNVLINSMCPSWVRTQMGGPNATRDVEEGVDTMVWLATLPEGGPSGQFFRDRTVIPW